MATPIRHPAVAGRFYPRDPDDLRAEVQSYLSPPGKTVSALGCVVPHAGYVYSGDVAGGVDPPPFLPPRRLLICPNHNRRRPPPGHISEGAWGTPPREGSTH